ncbi:MAG: hypothetical protein JWN14_3382, partial [Chthonomonadales bacterium]|nr:hypothetical protein [Chthonomonadales bacterium]
MRVCYLILSLFGGFAGLLAPSLPAVGQAKDAKTNVRLKSAAGASAPIKVHWQTPEVVNSEPLDASSIAFNTAPDGSAATALFNRQTLALD